MTDMKGLKVPEPLLTSDPDRFVMFPIRHKGFWTMYKKHVACFWTTDELDFSQDLADWQTLSKGEQHFISYVLAFFAAADGIVIENLATNVCSRIQDPAARAFYGFQIAMENIHSETYSLLIDTYIQNEKDKRHLFNAVTTLPVIGEKAAWAMKWIKGRSFGTMIAAFAIVEGLMFSSSFCALFWLKEQGKMPGLTFSNELISRDEGLHTDFAVLVFRTLQEANRPSKKKVRAMIREAVVLEKKFALEALPVKLIGMNSCEMSQYIEFVADRLCLQLIDGKIYNAKNPFLFMRSISIDGKTNFFEKRVGEYGRKQTQADQEELRFDVNDEEMMDF